VESCDSSFVEPIRYCEAGCVRGFAGFARPTTASLLLTQFSSPTALLPKIVLLDVHAYPMLLRNLDRHAQ
jgi:hypothetical protein